MGGGGGKSDLPACCGVCGAPSFFLLFLFFLRFFFLSSELLEVFILRPSSSDMAAGQPSRTVTHEPSRRLVFSPEVQNEAQAHERSRRVTSPWQRHASRSAPLAPRVDFGTARNESGRTRFDLLRSENNRSSWRTRTGSSTSGLTNRRVEQTRRTYDAPKMRRGWGGVIKASP